MTVVRVQDGVADDDKSQWCGGGGVSNCQKYQIQTPQDKEVSVPEEVSATPSDDVVTREMVEGDQMELSALNEDDGSDAKRRGRGCSDGDEIRAE